MRDSLTPFLRRRTADPSAPGRELTEPERRSLPGGFDAVAEALASGRSPVAACAVAGRALAWDGVSLGEALSGLRDTCAAVGVAAQEVAAVEALSVAWSEATLEFLHDVSCEDPLTGLASLPHLRTRLAELYREAEASGSSVRLTHALVVVDIGGDIGASVPPADAFTGALRLAAVADGLRTVFTGGETIARASGRRVLALVNRSPELGESVAIATGILDDVGLGGARLWIEGLPEHPSLAGRVLNDLT